jgi:hypothetical protein
LELIAVKPNTNIFHNPILDCPNRFRLPSTACGRVDGALAERHRISIQSRPTAEEREQLHALLSDAVRVDASAAKKIEESISQSRRFSPLKDFPAPHPPPDSAPEPRMADFWWHTHSRSAAAASRRFFDRRSAFLRRVPYNSDPLFPFGVARGPHS